MDRKSTHFRNVIVRGKINSIAVHLLLARKEKYPSSEGNFSGPIFDDALGQKVSGKDGEICIRFQEIYSLTKSGHAPLREKDHEEERHLQEDGAGGGEEIDSGSTTR